jgi:hypothetical protein
MTNKTRFLRLQSLVPYLQTEDDGDEVFIKYKNKKIAPADAKFYKVTTAPVQMNIEIELGKTDKWAELELWEYDHFSPNDSLGHFKLLVDQASNNFTAELIRKSDSSGKYALNWEIVERLNTKLKGTPPSRKKG